MTNGAITNLDFQIEIDHPCLIGDKLHIQLPEDINFDQNDNVTCVAKGSLLYDVTCSNSGDDLIVELLGVYSEPGILGIEI